MSGSGGLAVTPAKLVLVEKKLGEARVTAAQAKTSGARENVDANTWGLVGIPFAICYGNLKEQITEHLGLIEEFLKFAETGMKATAANYTKAEQANLEAIRKLNKKR